MDRRDERKGERSWRGSNCFRKVLAISLSAIGILAWSSSFCYTGIVFKQYSAYATCKAFDPNKVPLLRILSRPPALFDLLIKCAIVRFSNKANTKEIPKYSDQLLYNAPHIQMLKRPQYM